jgi:hypothetical protein
MWSAKINLPVVTLIVRLSSTYIALKVASLTKQLHHLPKLSNFRNSCIDVRNQQPAVLPIDTYVIV